MVPVSASQAPRSRKPRTSLIFAPSCAASRCSASKLGCLKAVPALMGCIVLTLP
nr:MAG TPA: hypothetical protein [Caudoviricetes sp.]